MVAQMVKCLSTMQETWVQSLGWEDPLEEKRQPTPVFLPRKSHGRSSLVQATVHGVAKSQARPSDFPFPMEYHIIIFRHNLALFVMVGGHYINCNVKNASSSLIHIGQFCFD